MKNKDQFKVLIYLNNQRAINGLTPIYVRILINGVRSVIATRHFVNPNHWNSRTSQMKPGSPNEITINSYLNDVRAQINQHYFHLIATKSEITAKILKNLFLGLDEVGKSNEKSITEAFDYHNLKMLDMVKIGKISPQTLMKFKITKNKVLEFIKLNYNKKDYPLSELRLRFVTEFEHFLLTKQSINRNTAHKYIKHLKKVINMAVGLDWMNKNPFTQFKCVYVSPDRKVLNQDELDLLINKELKIERMRNVRDVFVFCCYTGFAYADVFQFEHDAVIKGLDGEYWISKNRQKTGTKESVPLLPIALEIINSYRDDEYCIKHNKLLPVNSNQKYNAYLKELADICGIDKHLTTHIARHTFATTVTLANGVPIETVSSMLGHTNIRTTQIYAKVVEKKVSEDMQNLKAKLFPGSNNMKIVG
ncbi:MAG: site-specific integrase [Flavobacteriia bacterium]|nr:site-specific integrase [Flavobacteriia bacterium]